ncbi:MAG TPA: TonB-dependent receptor [Vicinamibacterales bacterium]|nr:TonB-dependent receptor [Vicinamibacterales bacterium]
MLKKTKLCTGLMVACGGVLLSAGQSSFAQQSNTQTLERVTVTGSNIKRTDTETASPVQIMTRQDIEKTGKQSIQEVLRTVTADGQGSIPASFSAGFASGSAAVSLRGLGVNSTLVLLNGRRMTTYGLADDGTRNFVDLNSIPLEVVDRIEVLKDGASAIYGADAVGGVVNIILRKNYNGGSVGGTYGQSSRSDGQTGRGFGTFGFGNLDTDKYNAFVSVEATHQNNILAVDRGFLGQQDLREKGFFDTTNGENRPWIGAGPTANSPYGVIRNPVGNVRTNVVPCDPSLISPNTGLCRYNFLFSPEIQPETDRLNIFGRGQLVFNPSLSAYLELGYFNRKTKPLGFPAANNDGGVFNPSDPLNPVVVHGLMNLPASHPDNPFGVDRAVGVRMTDFGSGERFETNNHVFRAVEGLQGTAWGWDFDVGAAYIKSRLEYSAKGFLSASATQAALTDGTYRFAGLGPSKTDPAVLATMAPDRDTTPTSSVKLIDFKASREVMPLEGGGLGVAVGAEMRWENANNPPVPGTDTSDVIGLGYSAFNSSRRVTALYGEVTAPVKKWLELTGALRYDHYSDFGDSWTPKVGFKVKPMDTLAIRGTYSEAFRAPGPAEVGGSSFGFTSIGILSIGQPGIKPETAKSYTLGLIFEPIAGNSATVDFWKIDRKNEIVQADPASIIPPGTPQTAAPFTKIPGALPNSFIYYDSTGQLATVSGNYANANKTTTSGVDLELRGRMRLAEAGNLTGTLLWTHTSKFERTDAQGNTKSYEGTSGPIVLSAGAGTPKDRASFSLTWDRGPFAVTGQVNYVGSMKLIDHKGEQAVDNGDGTVTDTTNGLTYPNNGDLNCAVFNPDGNPSQGCKLPSFTTFDLFGKWNPTKNWEVNLSIQNVFDRKAPFDPYLVLTYAINYNQTWHQSGAVGRFWTIGAKYTF